MKAIKSQSIQYIVRNRSQNENFPSFVFGYMQCTNEGRGNKEGNQLKGQKGKKLNQYKHGRTRPNRKEEVTEQRNREGDQPMCTLPLSTTERERFFC